MHKHCLVGATVFLTLLSHHIMYPMEQRKTTMVASSFSNATTTSPSSSAFHSLEERNKAIILAFT